MTNNKSDSQTKEIESFETKLGRLESLVKSMESGTLDLEQALVSYEEGVRLTRECQTQLDEAQQRINIIREKNGEQVEEPFELDQ